MYICMYKHIRIYTFPSLPCSFFFSSLNIIFFFCFSLPFSLNVSITLSCFLWLCSCFLLYVFFSISNLFIPLLSRCLPVSMLLFLCLYSRLFCFLSQVSESLLLLLLCESFSVPITDSPPLSDV